MLLASLWERVRNWAARRGRTVVAVAVGASVLLVLVLPAVAGTGGIGGIFPWGNGAPGAAPPDAASARLLTRLPAWSGYDASLWLVPREGAAPCTAIRFTERTTGAPPQSSPSAFANGGLNCNIGGSSQPAGEIQLFLDWYPASGTPWGRGSGRDSALLIHGHVPDGLSIIRVELRSAVGGRPLPLRQGYFFLRAPGLTSMGALPDEIAGSSIVALDRGGGVVASVALQRFLELAQPPS